MKKRGVKKLKIAVYGIGIFIILLVAIGIFIYSMNKKDFHDQVHLKVGEIKMEGLIDYIHVKKKISIKFSFLDKMSVPYKRFISNNSPVNIFMVSQDFSKEFHIVPKFDKFTGVFTVNENIDLLNKNYYVFVEVYPKNGKKTLFTYSIIINNVKNQTYPLVVDKGDNDYDGTYRARFYFPQILKAKKKQEISMRIFEKNGEVTGFQNMNGEYAYTWIVSSDGSVFLAPALASRAKLTWQLEFPKNDIYKMYVKTKINNKIHIFRHVFSVTEANILNENMPLMKTK